MKFCLAFLLGVQFCLAQTDSMHIGWYRINFQYQSNAAFTGDNGKFAVLNFTQFNLYQTNLSNAFATNTSSFQTHIKNYGIGLSYQYSNDAGVFSNQNLTLNQSYKIIFNPKNILSFGISASLNQSTMDFNKLSFFDQFNANGNVYQTNEPSPPNSSIYFPNYTIGMIYKIPFGYIGFNVQNLLEPTVSFYNYGYPVNNLSRNLEISEGIKLYQKKDISFYANAKADFNKLTSNPISLAGFQAAYKERFIGGVHLTSNDCLNFLLSVYHPKFRFILSYTKAYIFSHQELSNEGILSVGFTYVIKKEK
jgi:type IX secretion system PorP/SprF family membrane protein